MESRITIGTGTGNVTKIVGKCATFLMSLYIYIYIYIYMYIRNKINELFCHMTLTIWQLNHTSIYFFFFFFFCKMGFIVLFLLLVIFISSFIYLLFFCFAFIFLE